MAMTGGTAKLLATGTPDGWPQPISLYAYYKVKSQNVANNQTVLSLGMYITQQEGYYFGPWNDTYGSYIGTATSGANCKTFSAPIAEKTRGTVWLAEDLEVTVTHDNDGSKKATIYWQWGAASTWAAGFTSPETGSFSVTLPTIPRASTLDSLTCATSYFTGKMTYKYTPKSAAYYNRCAISVNISGSFTAVKTVNLGQKSAAQQTATVTLSESELSTIYNKLPSATKGTLRFVLRTYSDSGYSTQVGDPQYLEITLSIPDNSTTQADVTMTVAPVNSLPTAFDGLYIQGKSKVKATLSATGKYGATIKSYSMKVEGAAYDADDSYTSGYLTSYGSIKVYGYAEDSRGFTGSTSKDITVIAYAHPKILAASGESGVVAARCDANGNLSDTGTYLLIKARRSYSPVVSNGVQKNFCQIRYRYKLATADSYSAWTTILARDSVGSDEVVTGALLGGVLSVKSTYLVQIQAVDDVGGTSETTITVHTEAVYMHKTKNAMGLGKYVEEENLLDVAWNTHLRGEVRIGDSGMTLRDYILAVISEGG